MSDVREDLAVLHRAVASAGWTDLVHTHLSARCSDDPSALWLTPYGWLFDEVTPESLVRVSLDGCVLDDPQGAGVHPASGFHRVLMRVRRDVGCVMHTHTVAGAAVAALPEGLRNVSQHALMFHGRLAVHDYGGVALGADPAEALAADLGPHHAMILRHHGLLTTGRTVARAFERMHFLQRACEVQVAAGPGADTVPDDRAVAAAAQLSRPGRDAAEQTWAALRRRIAPR